VLFVGKQLGDYSKIVAHAKLSANGAEAINHIKTAPGRFSQFVMVIGTGPDQVVEVVQHELSPLMLWTLTTNADERNAVAGCSLTTRTGQTCRFMHGWLNAIRAGSLLSALGKSTKRFWRLRPETAKQKEELH